MTTQISNYIPGASSSIFPGLVNKLGGTQPSYGALTGIGNSSNISTGNNLTPQQNTNQQNINQGAQTSADISQNQTPAVQSTYQALQNLQTQDPLLRMTQANIPMAALISTGRGAQLGQALGAEEQAAANKYSAALQGEQQQLTGAQQQAAAGQAAQNAQLTGAQQAGSLANTAQSNQITGQTGALNAIQPQLGQYGQAYYNPLTGDTVGGNGTGANGGTLNPINNINSIAQEVISGQISPSLAYAMGGSVQNFQGALNAAIQQAQPGFDTAAAQGKYEAQQQNVTTSGTAGTTAAAQNLITSDTAAKNAAASGLTSANTEYQNNQANYEALTGISNQVTSTLANYANTGNLTDYNAAINTLQGHLSNPDYQKFITAIGNAQASYQSILGSAGVTPTKADQDAVAALNPNSSASTIVAALNQLSADAHSLIIQPSYQKVQNYKKQLGIQ